MNTDDRVLATSRIVVLTFILLVVLMVFEMGWFFIGHNNHRPVVQVPTSCNLSELKIGQEYTILGKKLYLSGIDRYSTRISLDFTSDAN